MRPFSLAQRVLVLLHLALTFLICLSSFAHAESRPDPLRIGAFNIQVFGQSKVNKPEVLDSILQILPRYDLVLIQEIRDSSNVAIFTLLDQLKARTGRDYRALVSHRLGRGEMKEQYAYIYDADRLAAHESYVFDDVDDKFEREPFITRFTGHGHDFAIAGIHITPTAVLPELQALNDVYRDMKSQFGHSNLFIAGDFNADCVYYKPAVHGFGFFDEDVRVLVHDDEDTTTAPSSCAYDRIFGFGEIQYFTSDAVAYNFMEEQSLELATAKLVSDHFPVEFTLEPTAEFLESGLYRAQTSPAFEHKIFERCGTQNYVSDGGYCYGNFSGSRRRVLAICCK